MESGDGGGDGWGGVVGENANICTWTTIKKRKKSYIGEVKQ